MELENNLSLSDIIFTEHSEVFAQKVIGEYTGVYRIISRYYIYQIKIWEGNLIIKRNTYPFSDIAPPMHLFFEKLNINSLNELENFILSKLLLE